MAPITNEIKQKLLSFYSLIRNKYPVRELFLYGSHAKGTSHKDSDIDVGVVLDIKDHSKRIDIGANLFHEAGKVDVAIEPKCIFWDEYLKHDKASILGEIIRTGIRIV